MQAALVRRGADLSGGINGALVAGVTSMKWMLITLVILVSACGRDTPSLKHLANDAVILSFGDSLSYGTGASAEQSYPAVLSNLIGRTVVRSGVPGEISAGGLSRLPRVLEEHTPALVILCHGGNDLLRKLSNEALERNLKAMIALIRAAGAEVLLVGVPKPAILGLGTAEVYRKVAGDLAVPLLDDTLADILGDTSQKSDHIHPNAAGYVALAQAIADFLRAAGAL